MAKRKGTNAVQVAEGLIEKVNDLKKDVIPTAVDVLVTRNYGRTADDKVNELMDSSGNCSHQHRGVAYGGARLA